MEINEIPPWKKCGCSDGSGNMLVYATPSCPYFHMIRGRIVTSKKECRKCRKGKNAEH